MSTATTGSHGGGEPLVSAIIPVYNGERFLAATLESLLSQTWPALEVIAVDDGSVDRSPAILGEYQEKFGGRLAVIRIPNSGVSTARNTGAGRATGSYVAFIDQDDLWAPEKVARQVTALSRSGLRISFTNMAIIDSEGRTRAAHACRFPAGDGVNWFEEILFDPVAGISTVMMERALFLEAGGFPPGLRIVEDYDLLLDILSRERPVVVDEDLSLYREHPGSGTRTRSDLLVRETMTVLGKWRERRPEVFRRNRARYAVLRCRLLFLRLRAGL
jgi:glycosyltransferase involved in cell wall biosynthesis